MKYVKIYDDKMRQTGLADIEQNYDKSGYVKVFDKDMQPIGVMDVDSIPESGANLPFVKVYDENLVMTGVVSVDNIRHSDGYLITLQKDPSTTGSVSGGGRFVSGTSVTVVATPDAQSEYTEFDGWYEGDTKVSENASYTFTVSGARTLVAKFVEPAPSILSVDLGLPSGTLWADRNVGAENETDFGLLFSWGNTEGHEVKNPSDYDFGDTYGSVYNQTAGSELTGNIVQGGANDAARVICGSPWKMPTYENVEELFSGCTHEYVTDYKGSGVNGALFTSKTNGKTLFLPACGFVEHDRANLNINIGGEYWTNKVSPVDRSYCFMFSRTQFAYQNVGNRRLAGFSIRGVA